MSIPTFRELSDSSSTDYRKLVSVLVRLERKHRAMTQSQFADLLGVPVRTYKRFELGTSDSLDIFLRIIIVVGRGTALDLVFPKPAPALQPRSPVAMMERLQQRKTERERAAKIEPEGKVRSKKNR
jgi:transcriptional regulator with XRE-family HTH domain